MANISYLATDIDETITKMKDISATAEEINTAVEKTNAIQSTAEEIDNAVTVSQAGGKTFIAGTITITTPSSISTSYGTGKPVSTDLTFSNPVVVAGLCGNSLVPAIVNAYYQPVSKTLAVSIYNADGLSASTTYTIGYLITDATS